MTACHSCWYCDYLREGFEGNNVPHLVIQYSENLGEQVNMTEICAAMSKALQQTGLFPLAGIRVRAYSISEISIADEHPDNAFADIILRIGEGRSEVQKAIVGSTLMETAKSAFVAQLAHPHFALSLEIIEISKLFSWKTNSIHPRLKD